MLQCLSNYSGHYRHILIIKLIKTTTILLDKFSEYTSAGALYILGVNFFLEILTTSVNGPV